MIREFRTFYFKLSQFALILFGVHFLINHYWSFQLEQGLFNTIHGFNIITSAIVNSAVVISFSKKSDKAGFVFLSCSILKMLITMIFIIPFVLPKVDYSQNFALQFTVVYFFYLIFECSIIIKKLNE